MKQRTTGARGAIGYIWQGPEGLPRVLQLEWRFVAIRWLGIVFVAPGILLAHLSDQHLVYAYLVLGAASLYNLTVQMTMQRWPLLFSNGYVTAIGDSLLNIAMINAGGGFNSPFYYLLFTVTISAAMRYGYGPALATVCIFVGLDTAESLTLSVIGATFVFRSGFLFITAILAGYLREQAQRAERALEERLRQADLLNNATATLGASLEFEPALRLVAAAARQLFGGATALIAAGEAPHAPDGTHQPMRLHDGSLAIPAAILDELTVLLLQGAADEERHSQPLAPTEHLLSDGSRAVMLSLIRPSRSAAVTLIVLLPMGLKMPKLDNDILESFAERTLLAIENAALYRTLASRGDDLQRAYADLASAHEELLSVDQLKTSFLANVSHELRTPLSSIRSFSELLLSYDNDAAVQLEFLQIINSESERLTRLVNDVLDITKIESGKMDWHMSTVDVSTLLREAARTFATLIAERGIEFSEDIAPDLPTINADRDRILQVVANLLNNAVKFTPAGSISLRATCSGDEVRIEVTDTGIGIPVEDHERIFEKFQQVGDTLTDKPKGTGLGLCISKDIVTHHHGRLFVQSAPGSGSTFTMCLPIREVVTNSAPEAFQAA